jgi:hypothetical protein
MMTRRTLYTLLLPGLLPGLLLGAGASLDAHEAAKAVEAVEAAEALSAVHAPANDPINTDWRTLLGLNYLTGETTEALESRRGKAVRIPGFMVPFEDGMSGVDEFLLVPYFGACIHTPAPPPNQIVYVKMQRGQRVEINIWDPVFVEGILEIQSIESPYGTVGHQVRGTAVRPYGDDR